MEVKGITIFVAIAITLAASGLGYTYVTGKAQSEANDDLGTEIEDLDSGLLSLQDILNALNGSLVQLSDDLDDLDVELRGDIADVEYDVSNIQTEIIQLQNDLSSIWEDFQTDIGDLEYDVSSLTDQISDIQSDLSTINAQITDLQGDLSDVQVDVTNLQGDLSDVQVDIANLQSDVVTLSAQITDIQNDISIIQSSIMNLQESVLLLQADVSSLEDRVTTLEMERAITIRVNFVSFVPDNVPPGGEDYLIDCEAVGTDIYAQARTGHSRFIEPRYLDLVVPNGVQFIGDQITISIYAYWHLNDMVIDIDPVGGPTIGTDPTGGYLSLTYTIGTILQGAVDGNDDLRLLDLYDAYFEYEVETIV